MRCVSCAYASYDAGVWFDGFSHSPSTSSPFAVLFLFYLLILEHGQPPARHIETVKQVVRSIPTWERLPFQSANIDNKYLIMRAPKTLYIHVACIEREERATAAAAAPPPSRERYEKRIRKKSIQNNNNNNNSDGGGNGNGSSSHSTANEKKKTKMKHKTRKGMRWRWERRWRRRRIRGIKKKYIYI